VILWDLRTSVQGQGAKENEWPERFGVRVREAPVPPDPQTLRNRESVEETRRF